MQPAAVRVGVIVVNWNGAAQLRACLDAFLAQDVGALEVVVVDNASSDGSAGVLRAYAADARVRVVWNASNRGFAGGVNDGLAATDAPVIAVANFDVVPQPDYLRHAVAALDAHPRRGSVQGKLVRTTRGPAGEAVIDTTGHLAFRTRLFRNRGEGEVDRGQWEQAGQVFGVSGALALYRRAMLDDVAVRGLVLDERLFAYWEDVDLDWRAALRGWEAWYEPAAVATHERGGAGPRRTRRVEALNYANRLLVVAKCDAPGRLARALPGVLFTTALKTLDLLVSHPLALPAALARLRHLPAMLADGRALRADAVVGPEQVVDRWFAAFDYARWLRTWWRRVRGRAPGH